MTVEELLSKVRDWDLSGSDSVSTADAKYQSIIDLLTYHAKNEWRDYVPAMHPSFTQDYMERLAAWVGNIDNDREQRLMLEYASYISFFSHLDFQALYRTAMEREVYRWIAEQVGLKLQPDGIKGFQERLSEELRDHTWFCPVTDSMDINEFYKANHLTGKGHRPVVSTLVMLSEKVEPRCPQIADGIKSYMKNPSLSRGKPAPPLERIVLLEDIVGSGSQCVESVEWTVKQIGKPVLFIPLILCPNGVEQLGDLVKRYCGQLTVRPIVQLRRGDLLGPERQGTEGWTIAADLEDFATSKAPLLKLKTSNTFGFKQTGCSLATFANTPDNSIPLIWKRVSGKWRPLFPRVSRGNL